MKALAKMGTGLRHHMFERLTMMICGVRHRAKEDRPAPDRRLGLIGWKPAWLMSVGTRCGSFRKSSVTSGMVLGGQAHARGRALRVRTTWRACEIPGAEVVRKVGAPIMGSAQRQNTCPASGGTATRPAEGSGPGATDNKGARAVKSRRSPVDFVAGAPVQRIQVS